VRASPLSLYGAGRREVLQSVLQGSRRSRNGDRVRLWASGLREVMTLRRNWRDMQKIFLLDIRRLPETFDN
jgi:hypothetical protein